MSARAPQRRRCDGRRPTTTSTASAWRHRRPSRTGPRSTGPCKLADVARGRRATRERGRRAPRRMPSSRGPPSARSAGRVPAPLSRPHRRHTSSSIAIVECLDMAMLHESLQLRVVGAGRPELPRLRRPGRVLPRPPVVLQRHPQHRVAHARGSDRRHHALERAVHALDVEVRAGARRGQHGRPQARRVVAPQLLAADGPRARGRVSTWRLQPCPGIRRRGRGRARERPEGTADLLHRLAGDGALHRRRRGDEPRAVHRRARRQGTVRRLTPTPTSTLAAEQAAGMYDDAGQVCLAGTRLLVDALDPRRVPRAIPARSSATSSVTAATRRPPSRRSSTPTTSRASQGFVERSRAAGDTLVFGGERLRHDGTVVRADAYRTAHERRRDRPARGLRASAHIADLRHRGRGDRARQLDALRALGDGLHGRPEKG